MKRAKLTKGRIKILVILLLLLGFNIADGTLAYFTNTEDLSHETKFIVIYDKILSPGIHIKLEETEWNKTGKEEAQNLVPGKTIPKDPKVRNIGDEDCYIRIKIKICDENGNEILNNTDEKILKIIEKSIVDLNTTNFNLKEDGYYYYCDKNKEDKILPKEGVTEKLFTKIRIPELRIDEKYFKDVKYELPEAFIINIEVHGVKTTNDAGEVISSEEAWKYFEEKNSQVSSESKTI